MKQSAFGQPQQLYQFKDICKYLQQHHSYLSSNQEYDLIQRNPIPSNFFKYIYDKFKNNYQGDVISTKSILESDPTLMVNSSIYDWSQDGDLITVKKKIISDYQRIGEDGKVPDLVKIEGDIIVSDFIEGRLYEEPLEYDVRVNNGKEIIIQMRVKTENWPILIIGPNNSINDEFVKQMNIDLDSSFLLALSCPERNDIYERLLLFSAWRSHYPSMVYMTKLLIENEDAEFYWSCKLLLEHMDTSMLLFIGVYLTNFKDADDYIVAENIFLFLLWEKDMHQATRYLGMIHLADVDGFNSDPKLAFQYFQYSAKKYGDQKSIMLMGQCYLSGIGVEQNIDEGKKILESLGIDPKPYLEKLNQNNGNENKETKKDSLTNSIISIAIGAGICAGVFFLLRRRGRK